MEINIASAPIVGSALINELFLAYQELSCLCGKYQSMKTSSNDSSHTSQRWEEMNKEATNLVMLMREKLKTLRCVYSICDKEHRKMKTSEMKTNLSSEKEKSNEFIALKKDLILKNKELYDIIAETRLIFTMINHLTKT